MNLDKHFMPLHVVIIPDGNRRWAKLQGMKPWEGHEAGAQNTEKLVRKALELDIKYMSFWGSSMENLTKRPLREKQELLNVYEKYFERLIESDDIHNNQVKINVIGKWEDQFPDNLKKIINKCIAVTKDYNKYNLNFFLAYSGDAEMVDVINQMIQKGIKKVTPEILKENLYTKDLPVVDYLIRTGGEPHLSAGFLMWDLANAQLYFSEKTYPDFDTKEFEKAINEYQSRGRRLGQ